MLNLPQYTLVVPEDEPCGCESGKTFGECHLVNGNVIIHPQPFVMPRITTNNRHRRCYLNSTWDCGHKITGEHILSKTLIKKIATKSFDIRQGDNVRTYGIDSQKFTVKRLCDRHNRAFHRIDHEAGRFMGAVQRINSDIKNISAGQLRLYFFNLFDLERWLLKSLINVYYSRLSVDPQHFHLPDNLIRFFFEGFRKPNGLYMEVRSPGVDRLTITVKPEAGFNLMLEGNTVTGFIFSFGGISLKLIIGGFQCTTPSFVNAHIYRPKTINFFRETEVFSIAMPSEDINAADVWLAHENPDAEIPVGIQGLNAPHFFKSGS